MTIQEIQAEIVEEFSMFDDWLQRYEYIIELGKTLPIIEEKYKTNDNIIVGCQSKVWLFAEEKEDKIYYTADSDAILNQRNNSCFNTSVFKPKSKRSTRRQHRIYS